MHRSRTRADNISPGLDSQFTLFWEERVRFVLTDAVGTEARTGLDNVDSWVTLFDGLDGLGIASIGSDLKDGVESFLELFRHEVELFIAFGDVYRIEERDKETGTAVVVTESERGIVIYRLFDLLPDVVTDDDVLVAFSLGFL